MNYAVTHFTRLEAHFKECVQELDNMEIRIQECIKRVPSHQSDLYWELVRTSINLEACAAHFLRMKNDVQSLKIGHPEIKEGDSKFPSCCSTCNE